MSRLTIASILETSEKDLFRKYQEPAKDSLDAPKATSRTDLRRRKRFVWSIRANSIRTAAPEAFPLAP